MPTCLRVAIVGSLLCLLSSLAAAGDGYDAARAEVLAGRTGKAIEMARAALKADPADVQTARLLHDQLVEAGREAEIPKLLEELTSEATRSYLRLRMADPEEAVEGFGKLQGQEGASPFAGLDLAYALWRADKRSAAETQVKTYLRAHPGDAEARVLQARIALEKSARAAQDPLEQALGLEPGRADAAVLLAQVLHELDKPTEARDVLTTALGLYAANYALRIGLAADHVRRDEADSAIAVLEPLVKDEPRRADGHAWLGLALRKLGELKNAEASTLKALELDPEHVLALETLGYLRTKQGKYTEAIDAYGKALKLAPERVEPYVGIAFVHILTNKLDFAKEMLDKALAIDKSHVDLNLKCGILWYLLGKYRTAKKHLAVVLKDDATHVPALRYTGYILQAEGKSKEASKLLQEALDFDPYDAMTMRILGRAYFELGNKDLAIELFERAVETDDTDAWAHFDLGKALDDQGEFEAAKQEYEAAIARDKTMPWPHIYLAEIWDEIDGEPVPALKHYKLYLELGGPDSDKTVEKRIEQLEG